MPGFNPDNINIHDLVIEEPAKEAELFFDADKEITEGDWESMKDQLDESRRIGDVFSFALRAAAMKILKPEMAVKIRDTEYANIKKSLESWRKKSLDGFFKFAMAMKIIDPEFNVDPYVGNRSEIRGYFEEKKNNNLSEYIGTAARVKVVAPNKADKSNIDQETWGNIKELLNNSKKNLTRYFAEKASEVKILSPKEEFNLTREDWDEMRSLLHDLRGDDMYAFSQQAMAMKILAAEKVQATDKGLEIMMQDKKEPIVSESPDMPENRKF